MHRIKSLVKQHFPRLLPPLRATKHLLVELRRRLVSNRRRFEDFYRKNKWGDPHSRSGPGSTLEQTRVIREEIPKSLSRIGAKSMLDIPCGDFYWMKEVELGIDTYIGGDIVREMIEANCRAYGRENRIFRVMDLTKTNLPAVDVVFCRDCLVHLSYKDIARAVANIKKSGAIYLLTTTFTGERKNCDIVTEDWQPLNLEKAPLNWPPPLLLINEGCTQDYPDWADKCLGLWRVTDLPG